MRYPGYTMTAEGRREMARVSKQVLDFYFAIFEFILPAKLPRIIATAYETLKQESDLFKDANEYLTNSDKEKEAELETTQLTVEDLDRRSRNFFREIEETREKIDTQQREIKSYRH